jgi:succinoglycan biosynthesis protein ExoA
MRLHVADSLVISVIVPCRNEELYIGALLLAVGRQTSAPAEIVVVDGGSTDATLRAIDEAASRIGPIAVHTIVAPDDRLPQALNRAIRKAEGSVIVRLDAHSAPPPDFLTNALSHLRDGSVGVVGGPWKVVPGGRSAVAAAIARAVAHPFGAGNAAYRLRVGGAPETVDTVPFGCFTRRTWQQVNGYNESLLGNEDYEFNYRVRKTGLAVLLDPSMRLTYVARATLRALALQYFRYGWCKTQMLRLHPRSLKWRQAVPAAFVAGLTAALLLSPVSRTIANLLALTLVGYGGVVAATVLSICASEGGWRRAPWLAAAFITIHFCWGTGALVHAATGGRWPDREFLFGIKRGRG